MGNNLKWPQDFLGKVIEKDCLEVMKQMPDDCVDLILTDPPYGIDYGKKLRGKGDGKGGADKNGWKSYDAPTWDKDRPTRIYFDEMRRVSKNQIIWGANYFTEFLPPRMGWMVWDKGQREFSLADGELAWTSYDRALRIYTYSRGAALQDGKEHPTQKPRELFAWCLNRCKDIKTVFDPFLGSGTTALVCEQMGIQWSGVEREKSYCKIAESRIEAERSQGKLF